MNKDKLKSIDDAFSVLKETPDSTAALKIISDTLEKCFNAEFCIKFVDPLSYSPLFVMSIFPEVSTMDKIIKNITDSSDTSSATIKSLWEKNKVWTIEIDNRILDNSVINLTNRELTALLLHEIGHVKCSNSISNRLSMILQYEYAKTGAKEKLLLREEVFRQIMTLPVLNALVSVDKKSGKEIKNEIKADSFARSMGYTIDLGNALKKLLQCNKYAKDKTVDERIRNAANFSINTINQLKERDVKLSHSGLLNFTANSYSPFVKESAESMLMNTFGSLEENNIEESVQDHILKMVDVLSGESAMYEFFSSGTKRLKRIDPAELDYIEIKMREMKTENDKMMLISYLHSKIDIIDYYISILDDPALSKKYDVPHNMNQLTLMKSRLLTLRESIINYKLPEKEKGFVILYPDGYQG